MAEAAAKARESTKEAVMTDPRTTGYRSEAELRYEARQTRNTTRPRAAARGHARRRVILRTLAASAVACTAIFGGLSLQLAAGQDPALAPKARMIAAARDAAPNKRIIKKTTIVRKIHPAEPVAPAPSAPSSSAGYSSGYSASSVPAPAPAPAPAPVVTASS